MPARPVYRLDLTPHQRAALLTALHGYLMTPDHVEVSIDAATGEEIALTALLTLVLQLNPIAIEQDT